MRGLDILNPRILPGLNGETIMGTVMVSAKELEKGREARGVKNNLTVLLFLLPSVVFF